MADSAALNLHASLLLRKAFEQGKIFDQKSLKRHFTRLAKGCHPDLHPSSEAAHGAMVALKQQYEELKSEIKKLAPQVITDPYRWLEMLYTFIVLGEPWKRNDLIMSSYAIDERLGTSVSQLLGDFRYRHPRELSFHYLDRIIHGSVKNSYLCLKMRSPRRKRIAQSYIADAMVYVHKWRQSDMAVFEKLQTMVGS